ncbi:MULTISPECIES: hypothetical protein [unclassified Curtobacterium]|jgi:hypothetical protein|uniref:hypothetical protein n=1 Tax=unclassified Curtobacterium TaxID=257496 RepID=UPI000F488E6C|nr:MULTISPECIES: hypothetical protein [unclassified Curtobacterium]ROQ04941.1 hypothetical protein EDF41_3060 [Curtobacterium sp. PhB171]ROQ22142.1 hypothetical protein EDF40_3228 [Curtobacterium sp. PhB170]ROS33502.1 hypothetical protein EDF25_2883 [Curtobacterium sp. PhB131]ROS64821.1 hypothetical protein EDF30_3235 [Curtobacterium sp. PhB141]
MYLGIRPEGVALTPEQAKLLDDEFFLANPLEHFTARIHLLLGSELTAPTRDTHPKFFEALGLAGVDTLPTAVKQREDVHRAIDAVVLRHQCAEALERFLYALTAARPRGDDAPCTWLAIADSPTGIHAVATATKQAFDEDEQLLLKFLYPAGTVITEDLASSCTTALAWINHATHLLLDDELPVNAAYNKLKHGLAVTTRDDVRIQLISTQPNADGTVPLSAFGEGRSTPIFDRPLVTYLTRPRTKGKQPQPGVEAVTLRIDVPTVLAETWMMANVYAALFHVAAVKHHNGAPPDGIAPRPALVVDRTPDRVLRGQPLGYRSPVTLPSEATGSTRPEGLALAGRFIPMRIDLSSRRRGRIVEG